MVAAPPGAYNRNMFVILEHTNADGVHWDFIVQIPGCELLPTWRLAHNPLLAQGNIPAQRIADHPRHFLEYEGQLREGRGHVWRVERGKVIVEQYDIHGIVARLAGGSLIGLYHIHPDEHGDTVFSSDSENSIK